MLTIQDCIELSELSEDEILAIAEHEHIPEMAAVEMGNYLCHTPPWRLRKISIACLSNTVHSARQRASSSDVLSGLQYPLPAVSHPSSPPPS